MTPIESPHKPPIPTMWNTKEAIEKTQIWTQFTFIIWTYIFSKFVFDKAKRCSRCLLMYKRLKAVQSPNVFSVKVFFFFFFA